MDVNKVLKLCLNMFKNDPVITFSYVCAYPFVLGYVHLSAGAYGGQRQKFSHPTWVLGT